MEPTVYNNLAFDTSSSSHHWANIIYFLKRILEIGWTQEEEKARWKEMQRKE